MLTTAQLAIYRHLRATGSTPENARGWALLGGTWHTQPTAVQVALYRMPPAGLHPVRYMRGDYCRMPQNPARVRWLAAYHAARSTM